MSGKKKTTFAKLARESKLRERRMVKQAKKDARKLAGGYQYEEHAVTPFDEADEAQSAEPDLEPGSGSEADSPV